MSSKEYISEEGLEKLKQELENFKTVKRQEIAQRLEEAKKMGDLSENAEYTEAREAQEFNEREIAEMEDLIKKAIVIGKTKNKDEIQVGSVFVVKSHGKEQELTIVGSEEADPIQGKISNESPLGKAFLGKKKGDDARIKTPKGEAKYTIEKIIS
ncbi:MAG: Transcription elongation factor GreA [Parcubacteria group bacterium GW2011_GWD2_38_12]|uniref:Transcription elongation factor GreA n=1 Tax=Candidatus Azambacteria bacterium RIFCSPLOWO2_01_FULL_37_9 TaxID=1797297 RepID=A0A1F5C8W7_9BACT|nr:MAG: Transcription elongation factor GreA [Parcubacteria group bacterium GW2011_GWC2_36_17]KKQ39415.1 MAG: Transcription elongation factor GreA [Candidatus Moranbacteria bacterium GW2011_GWF2_37_7]KKQ43910.1 MAG: Transcription elongation factor GreA [Parcubacteria group bacterium GW2011_GWE2_37_8]KKQ52840.1 MAG: Transcription elongation factor GreA [Parcubacteria group bacterium GW2011_GWD2_38_12]KKQ59043.1 MAG: Transcription elongation factor GreA [Parcubacteria group bacterium GW2011_GWC1_